MTCSNSPSRTWLEQLYWNMFSLNIKVACLEGLNEALTAIRIIHWETVWTSFQVFPEAIKPLGLYGSLKALELRRFPTDVINTTTESVGLRGQTNVWQHSWVNSTIPMWRPGGWAGALELFEKRSRPVLEDPAQRLTASFRGNPPPYVSNGLLNTSDN